MFLLLRTTYMLHKHTHCQYVPASLTLAQPRMVKSEDKQDYYYSMYAHKSDYHENYAWQFVLWPYITLIVLAIQEA